MPRHDEVLDTLARATPGCGGLRARPGTRLATRHSGRSGVTCTSSCGGDGVTAVHEGTEFVRAEERHLRHVQHHPLGASLGDMVDAFVGRCTVLRSHLTRDRDDDNGSAQAISSESNWRQSELMCGGTDTCPVGMTPPQTRPNHTAAQICLGLFGGPRLMSEPPERGILANAGGSSCPASRAAPSSVTTNPKRRFREPAPMPETSEPFSLAAASGQLLGLLVESPDLDAFLDKIAHLAAEAVAPAAAAASPYAATANHSPRLPATSSPPRSTNCSTAPTRARVWKPCATAPSSRLTT
jgi:hypothetical protein